MLHWSRFQHWCSNNKKKKKEKDVAEFAWRYDYAVCQFRQLILFEMCGYTGHAFNTHPAYFHQIGHHDDGCRILLPDHFPEVEHRLLHGPWRETKDTNVGEKKQRKVRAWTDDMVPPSSKNPKYTLFTEAESNIKNQGLKVKTKTKGKRFPHLILS